MADERANNPEQKQEPARDEWLETPLREGQAPAPSARAELRNLGLETVDDCARRMLAEHAREGKRIPIDSATGRLERLATRAELGLSVRGAARLTAEAVARSWRQIGNDRMADFYGRVAATLSEG